ncbi:MAG: hypothetical protein AABW46_00675 [Nanoarchaeota archaeon]
MVGTITRSEIEIGVNEILYEMGIKRTINPKDSIVGDYGMDSLQYGVDLSIRLQKRFEIEEITVEDLIPEAFVRNKRDFYVHNIYDCVERKVGEN